MIYRSQSESVKPVEIDYSTGQVKKCTYTRDQKPEKDPFDCKSLKGEWL